MLLLLLLLLLLLFGYKCFVLLLRTWCKSQRQKVENKEQHRSIFWDCWNSKPKYLCTLHKSSESRVLDNHLFYKHETKKFSMWSKTSWFLCFYVMCYINHKWLEWFIACNNWCLSRKSMVGYFSFICFLTVQYTIMLLWIIDRWW